MDDTKDLLQIKIEKAKALLPKETLAAINAVDWRVPILELKEKKGYNFEQLGDLEVETELLLCGLITSENYKREIKSRMVLSENQTNEIVNYMNAQVFSKIKEELIKNTERRRAVQVDQRNETLVLGSAGIKIVEPATIQNENTKETMENKEMIMKAAGIEIVPTKSEEKFKKDIDSILTQKLSAPVRNPIIKTEHTLDNITKNPSIPPIKPPIPIPPSSVLGTIKPPSMNTKNLSPSYTKGADPYRMSTE